MAPITEYTAELLEHAARNMKGLLRPENDDDAKLVQKGLLLYRQGLVSGLRFSGDDVTASVQDVTPAHVKLDLTFLEVSECSCPVDGFCRHQLAVFFQALSHAGSVAAWVEDWREPLKAKTAATNWGLKTAKDLLKTTKKVEASYEDWTASFAGSFRMIMHGQGDPKPYVVPELFRVYWRKIKADAPFKVEWRSLHELIAAVQSFNMLAVLARESGHTEVMVERYYQHIFHGLIEDVEKSIARLGVQSLPFAFDSFIDKLRGDTRDLLATFKGLEFEGIHIYRWLWVHILKNPQWRSEERERLEALLSEDGIRGDFTPETLPLMVGLSDQYILAKKDEESLQLMRRLKAGAVPQLTFWLEQFAVGGDWKQSGPFIDLFVSQLNGYLLCLGNYDACQSFTRLALEVTKPYYKETGRDDLYERMLVQSLPYSYRVYDLFLFSQGSFTKWVELQAFIGVDLDYLGMTQIKEVQKREPAALLPLYHQSIQNHIDLKNRTNYRVAVKQLKKLKTIYKKVGRLDEWERFFGLLLSQTKRLRAFQEECVRGKLIDA
jgi:hypothetical protein